MRVRATQTGYYNHGRIKEGTVFSLVERKGLDHAGKKITLSAEAQFSAKWMEKLDGSEMAQVETVSKSVAARGKAKQGPAKQEADDSEVI